MSVNSSFSQSKHCSRCLWLTTSSCSLENKHAVLTHLATKASLGVRADLLLGPSVSTKIIRCVKDMLLSAGEFVFKANSDMVWSDAVTCWCLASEVERLCQFYQQRGWKVVRKRKISKSCDLSPLRHHRLHLASDLRLNKDMGVGLRKSPRIWGYVCFCFGESRTV